MFPQPLPLLAVQQAAPVCGTARPACASAQCRRRFSDNEGHEREGTNFSPCEHESTLPGSASGFVLIPLFFPPLYTTMTLPRLLPVAILLLLAGCVTLDGNVKPLQHSASRSATVGADGAEQVRVDAGAGSLEVVGRANLDEVRANGTARTSRRQDLEQIQIEATRSGDEVTITTLFPEDTEGRAQLDLTVEVPQHLAATIDDSSGDLTITNLAGPTLEVNDSSGDLTIRVNGPNTSIEDSSGDLDLRNAGAADISDSSGDIGVFDLNGGLTLDDSSGDIEVSNLGDGLTLDDSSGDIRAEGVDGDVNVTDDSSGDIRLRDVTGRIQIDEDSSGDIILREVGGSVRIGADTSGDIVAERIGGDFAVGDDTSGDIRHEGVTGSVSIPDDD
jgi:DUF4097 and DUF4098 domain-containing protein YvlB